MTELFYRAFEDRFRGSRELIKSRLQVYLPFLQPFKEKHGVPKALDLGCGRGEWLELLQHQGFAACGVDLDEGMLLECKRLDLEVQQGDALSYIKALPNDSISVISAFHVIEHIPFEMLHQLVQEVLRVLEPGGLLIFETPNSENLSVGTSTFYLDPSHQRPLPAKLVAFLMEYTGFDRVKTLFLQESPELATHKKINLATVIEGSSPDYAIIAQKKSVHKEAARFDAAFAHRYGVLLSELAHRYDQQITDRFEEQQHILHFMEEKFDSAQNGLNKQMVTLAMRYDRQLAEHLETTHRIIHEMNQKITELLNHFQPPEKKTDAPVALVQPASSKPTPSSLPTLPKRFFSLTFKMSRHFSNGMAKLRYVLFMLKKAVRMMLIWPARKILSNARIKGFISDRFAKHPELKQRLRHWAMKVKLIPRSKAISPYGYIEALHLKASSSTDEKTSLSMLSPKAKYFYMQLKKNINDKEI